MGGENDLHVGVELEHHVDEALLPLEVEARLGFIHEEDVRLAVLCEGCEQDDEHLLLATGEFVGRELLSELQETQFVARAVNALSRFREKVVHKVKEHGFICRCLRCLFFCVGRTTRQELNHAVAHIHLIVQVAALELIELPVQFRRHRRIGQCAQAVALYELTVEGADDVVADIGRVRGIKVNANPKMSSS